MKRFIICFPFLLSLQAISPAQQSTSGPVPPKGMDIKGLPGPSTDSASKVISGVPAYLWRHGCGPTALGMVVGYYDTHGFPLLFPGSGATQTYWVNQYIASQGSGSNQHGQQRHYEDYSLPKDYPNTGLKKDRSTCYPGCTHKDDCIADFMYTSWYTQKNCYGWSWFKHVGQAFKKYAKYRSMLYNVSMKPYTIKNTNINTMWSILRREINENRPLVLLVDTDGDGWTDHFVTAIGYSEGASGRKYCCHHTRDRNKHWYYFRKISKGATWGVYGFWTFKVWSIRNGFKLLHSLDGWAYRGSFTTSTTGTEYLQGFPGSHFCNVKALGGIYVYLYLPDRSKRQSFTVKVRKASASGKPLMTSPPLYRQTFTTPKGSGAGTWQLYEYFDDVVSLPAGTFWIGIYTPKGSPIQMIGLNQHGAPGTALCGVCPRKGVTPNLAYYSNYNNPNYPGPLKTSKYFWVWDIGARIVEPTLQSFSVCSIRRGKCPANRYDLSYGGMWPDVNNAGGYSPGRFDNLGWLAKQANHLSQTKRIMVLLYYSGIRATTPTPFGDLCIVPTPGNSMTSTITLPSIGKYLGPYNIPNAIRPILVGSRIYAQAGMVELSQLGTILKIELTNMAGMSL